MLGARDSIDLNKEWKPWISSDITSCFVITVCKYSYVINLYKMLSLLGIKESRRAKVFHSEFRNGLTLRYITRINEFISLYAINAVYYFVFLARIARKIVPKISLRWRYRYEDNETCEWMRRARYSANCKSERNINSKFIPKFLRSLENLNERVTPREVELHLEKIRDGISRRKASS